jgi:hypothetical protein
MCITSVREEDIHTYIHGQRTLKKTTPSQTTKLTSSFNQKSGASRWTTARREDFANDVDSPQLWAVTDNVNQQKSDQGPDEWKPPLQGFHCTYACAWIAVKDKYDLTASTAEVDALEDMLSGC